MEVEPSRTPHKMKRTTQNILRGQPSLLYPLLAVVAHGAWRLSRMIYGVFVISL